MNSSHHQCVEVLGANLTVAARAEDPIIEAMQWKNAKENPFYLGVQVKRRSMVEQSFQPLFLFCSGIRNEWSTKRVHFHSTFVKHFSTTSPNIKINLRSIRTKDPTVQWTTSERIIHQQSPALHRTTMVRIVTRRNSMTSDGDTDGWWTCLLHIYILEYCIYFSHEHDMSLDWDLK